MKTIHITSGDLNGIGLEVSLKALYELQPIKNIQFVLWRDINAQNDIITLADKVFKRVTYNTFNNDILTKKPHQKENILLDIAYSSTPTQWVVEAAQYCMQKKTTTALVTAPLSKTQMQKEGFKEKGHTPLLQKLSGAEHVFMTFLGKFFNVVLLTGHVPLKKITWNTRSFNKCIKLCLDFKKNITHLSQKNDKKLAILGFNPHAGENGLLGTEETTLKKELVKWKPYIEGPLVPDVAFFKQNWDRFFLYLCLYHDQGLIPFKAFHERHSFQLSLGLPFIRTSVSHGTATDIFKQNKADSQSMKQALLWAIKSL